MARNHKCHKCLKKVDSSNSVIIKSKNVFGQEDYVYVHKTCM